MLRNAGRRPTRWAFRDCEIVAGDPAEAVLEATRGDMPVLVAVGSRGLGMVGRVRLGNVSTKIVTAAPGPVLVFPHTE